MSDDVKVIVYIPTDEERELLKSRCCEIIDIMDGLTMEQKATVIHIVSDTLAKNYGLKSVRIPKEGEDD